MKILKLNKYLSVFLVIFAIMPIYSVNGFNDTSKEFFEQLFYESGGWLGITIILSFAFLISYFIPYSFLIFEIILLMLGISYFNKVPSNSDLLWAGIICFLSMFLLIFIGGRDRK